jgi:hypothetical protein
MRPRPHALLAFGLHLLNALILFGLQLLATLLARGLLRFPAFGPFGLLFFPTLRLFSLLLLPLLLHLFGNPTRSARRCRRDRRRAGHRFLALGLALSLRLFDALLHVFHALLHFGFALLVVLIQFLAALLLLTHELLACQGTAGVLRKRFASHT